jgi:hypothetical protein
MKTLPAFICHAEIEKSKVQVTENFLYLEIEEVETAPITVESQENDPACDFSVDSIVDFSIN